MSFGGGPLIPTPELVSLFWGPFTYEEHAYMFGYLQRLANHMSGSDAPAHQEPVVRQYGVQGATVGVSFLDSTAPATATEAEIHQKVLTLQSQGHLPGFASNRLFLLFTKNITFVDNSQGNYGSDWVGYHENWGEGQFYALVPFPFENPAANEPAWQAITSHETFEASTDPFNGTGWTRAAASGGRNEGGDGFEGQVADLPFGRVQYFADNRSRSGSIWTPAWTKIGMTTTWANALDVNVPGTSTPATVMYAGGEHLYAAIPGATDIYRYEGTPMIWTRIGGPGSMFAANTTTLFGLTPDKQSVWQFSGTPENWTRIGGPAQAIYAGGNSLYAIYPDGDVYEYNRVPGNWVRIGGPGSLFAANDTTLVGLNPYRSQVWQYTGDSANWVYLYDAANAIAASGDQVYLLNGFEIWRKG
jgi:hypothetical protein